MKCALSREGQGAGPEADRMWHWWLGRLNFLERVIQRFSWDFLLASCIRRPPFCPPSPSELDNTPMSSITSLTEPLLSLEGLSDEDSERNETTSGPDDGMESRPPRDTLSHPTQNTLRVPSPQPHLTRPPFDPTPGLHPAAENNLLAQAWYFAAQATHVPHNKVSKVARRVIIRIAKVLRDEPFSLEIVHDVVSRCHRTQAEGLLDRVYKAREKSLTSSYEGRDYPVGREVGKQGGRGAEGGGDEEVVRKGIHDLRVKKEGVSSFDQDPEAAIASGRRRGASPGQGGVVTMERRKSDGGSDDSYRSAVSDLSGDERERRGGEGSEGGGRSDGGGVGGGGGGGGGASGGGGRKGKGLQGDSEGREVSSSGTSSESKSEERQMRSTASGGGGEDKTLLLPRWVWLVPDVFSSFPNCSHL